MRVCDSELELLLERLLLFQSLWVPERVAASRARLLGLGRAGLTGLGVPLRLLAASGGLGQLSEDRRPRQHLPSGQTNPRGRSKGGSSCLLLLLLLFPLLLREQKAPQRLLPPRLELQQLLAELQLPVLAAAALELGRGQLGPGQRRVAAPGVVALRINMPSKERGTNQRGPNLLPSRPARCSYPVAGVADDEEALRVSWGGALAAGRALGLGGSGTEYALGLQVNQSLHLCPVGQLVLQQGAHHLELVSRPAREVGRRHIRREKAGPPSLPLALARLCVRDARKPLPVPLWVVGGGAMSLTPGRHRRQ